MAKLSTKDVDFDVIREEWTRYKLVTDNAMLRVRVAILKLIEIDTGAGVPNFDAAAHNLIGVSVPETLLKPEGEGELQKGEITPEQIKEGTEIDFQSMAGPEQWQEYRTKDGWIVMVRPEVGRIVRLKSYVALGPTKLLEPVYWVNIQTVFRVKKAKF